MYYAEIWVKGKTESHNLWFVFINGEILANIFRFYDMNELEMNHWFKLAWRFIFV